MRTNFLITDFDNFINILTKISSKFIFITVFITDSKINKMYLKTQR